MIPVPQLVAAVEGSLRQIECHEADHVCTRIVGILNTARPQPVNITSPESNALKELQKNASIVAIPADKGQASVVMDRSEKACDLLSDQWTYWLQLYDHLCSSAGKTPLFHEVLVSFDMTPMFQ